MRFFIFYTLFILSNIELGACMIKDQDIKPRNLIGERVKAAREHSKPPISQNDLSARLAVRGIELSRSAISKIESKSRPVTDIQLVAIAKSLGVSVTWLLEIDH